MIYNWTWEIWLILLLQDTGDWLTPLMEVFTWTGYPQAYMILIAVIYWAFDRKLGMRLAIFLPLSASVNSILKQAIHAPRPFWVDNRILAIHAENGFGMPSGHAQSATVWLLAGAYLRKGWIWILAMVLTLGVGLSRAYLGVHSPSQIIVGWLIGIVLIILFLRFESSVLIWLGKLKLFKQLLFVLACSMLIFLLGSIFVLMLNSWEMPFDWIRNASAYLPVDRAGLMSYGMASVTGNTGSFLGVTMGAILIHRKGNFNVAGLWWIRLLRIVLGLICLVLLYTGLQLISPDTNLPFLYAGWRFLGFYFIAISAVYILPLLFTRLNLLQMKS
ncbi:phosphatase PAP2 family protein [Bacteroidota bacterium]